MNKTLQTSVSTTDKVRAGANEVWDKIVAFGGTQKYVPSLIDNVTVQGTGLGAVRTIQLHGGGAITERLTHIDSSSQLMKYIILSTPMPIQQYEASTQVSALDDNTCEVRFESSYEVSEDNHQEINTIIKKFQEEFISNLHL